MNKVVARTEVKPVWLKDLYFQDLNGQKIFYAFKNSMSGLYNVCLKTEVGTLNCSVIFHKNVLRGASLLINDNTVTFFDYWDNYKQLSPLTELSKEMLRDNLSCNTLEAIVFLSDLNKDLPLLITAIESLCPNV